MSLWRRLCSVYRSRRYHTLAKRYDAAGFHQAAFSVRIAASLLPTNIEATHRAIMDGFWEGYNQGQPR